VLGKRKPAAPGDPAGARHAVLGTPLLPPYPEPVELAIFGMGCFWGAERLFWEAEGVLSTAVGYAAGATPNPTYEQVCSGRTGHAEAVLVAFRPPHAAGPTTSYSELLRLFWEGHDPTQGMRQGNDVGSQYRSLIIALSPAQLRAAEQTKTAYEAVLAAAGLGPITTEIQLRKAAAGKLPPATFHLAEPYHQQYLAKNPLGYCGLGGTGVPLPAAGVASGS